ncbi:MAG: glycosyltransferase family 4 protein [Cyanobacteria bacterium J06597_1]
MSVTTTDILMLGPGLGVSGGMTSVETLILETPLDDIEIEHISSFEEGVIGRKLTVFLSALGKLVGEVIARPIGSVHVHVSYGGSALRAAIIVLLMSVFRKPVMLHMHGSEFHVFFAKIPTAAKQLLGAAFRKCQYMIVLSDSWKAFYSTNLGIDPDKVIVLPNPVKLPSTVPSRSTREQVRCVFLGRLGQRKGTFELLRAFAALPAETLANALLVVAGDGEIEKAKQLAAELGISERVEFAGWVGRETRDRLLAESNIFVLPSHNEGLPMAVLEAMGWGLAVITTPVGGIPELVTPDDDGVLVEPGNVEELTAALKRLIEDESTRKLLGERARARVTPLSVDTYMEKLSGLYKSMHSS